MPTVCTARRNRIYLIIVGIVNHIKIIAHFKWRVKQNDT